jgi:GNAT superfamily N-acetyltransferase
LESEGQSAVTLIIEATEADNDALNELQKKCPMGTSLVLGVDSSPNYFVRSRAFEDWHVFVAVENDIIVGSAAVAIKDICVEDRKIKAAYEYGFMVDPFHRRKGIAEKLQRHLEQIALNCKVDLLHLDIIEDNIPSIRLFSKMGFTKGKDCTTFSLMPYKEHKITLEADIRSMEMADVDAVTKLINETYHDYDFFIPYRPHDFLEALKKMRHFDLNNILLLEDNDGIKACLGYWEYHKVRKYIVQKLNWKLKAQTYMIRTLGLFTKMPHIPKLGEVLQDYNLTIVAYRDPESIAELIRNVVNIALKNKINFIHVTVDPMNPISAILSQFRHTKMKLYFFTKVLKQGSLPNFGERRLYFDALEM